MSTGCAVYQTSQHYFKKPNLHAKISDKYISAARRVIRGSSLFAIMTAQRRASNIQCTSLRSHIASPWRRLSLYSCSTPYGVLNAILRCADFAISYIFDTKVMSVSLRHVSSTRPWLVQPLRVTPTTRSPFRCGLSAVCYSNTYSRQARFYKRYFVDA